LIGQYSQKQNKKFQKKKTFHCPLEKNKQIRKSALVSNTSEIAVHESFFPPYNFFATLREFSWTKYFSFGTSAAVVLDKHSHQLP
jgi:hypothetical protein